jgi:uncharacterized protein YjbJ (UPF0337 family)
VLTGRQLISLTCLSTTGFGCCGIPPSRWNHWRRSSTGSSTGRCWTLLCVEGSIATGPDGTILFNTFDGKPKRDLVYELCSVADYVLALGTCARPCCAGGTAAPSWPAGRTWPGWRPTTSRCGRDTPATRRCAIRSDHLPFSPAGSWEPGSCGGNSLCTGPIQKNSGPAEGVKGVVEDVKGKAKEAIGTVTGRDDMVREGKAQQDKADAQRDVAEEGSRGGIGSRRRQGRRKAPGSQPVSERKRAPP